MATRAPARVETFAFFCGLAYFAIGLLGLMPQALTRPPAGGQAMHVTMLHGELLGLFPVNVAHSAAHIAIGAWGIAAGRSLANPTIYARVLAVFFAALALMGLAPDLDTVFGVLPLHGPDVWLHGATAAVAAYFGWHPSASLERRSAKEADRRQKSEPVGRERRTHHGDRRLPGSEV
jgi:hypothetical protein